MSMNEGYLVVGIVISIIVGVSFSFFKVYNKSPFVKDIFFLSAGLTIFFFCFGYSAFHVIGSAIVFYLLMWCIGISGVSCCTVLLGCLSYLLYGYITTSGVSYTITWTLIHCQVLLKICGYFFELYDAKVRYPQSFLTYMAYCCFPCSCLVGPSHSFKDYEAVIYSTKPPNALPFARRRFTLALVYIGVFYGVGQVWSTKTLLSHEFLGLSFPLKVVFWTMWSKWLITKYCGVWMVAETAASFTGLGADASGAFESLRNMDIYKFETSVTIQDELSSFNIKVHQWVKTNIYKRCRFLGNPVLSRIIALLFLYLWHGFYFGFFNLFLIEALGIETERILFKHINADILYRYIPRYVCYPAFYLLKNACVGYGLCGFALRTFERCHIFYKSVYYCFHWIMPVIILLDVMVGKLGARRRSSGEMEKED